MEVLCNLEYYKKYYQLEGKTDVSKPFEKKRNMKKLKTALALIMAFITLSTFTIKEEPTPQKVKILLMGDSTTEGGKPIFEKSIEQLIDGEKGIPEVEVVNVGKGGETAYSLLNSGRYEEQIKGIDSVDYIFFRYGINDWFKRQPFEENFPQDMKIALDRVREDFPEAEIILMTITPFLKKEEDKIVNEWITKIAAEEKLELFNIYPAYAQKLEELGENAMSFRFVALSDIPENYHTLVAPFTRYYDWKEADWVRVQTNEFDPLFGHLPNWYKDRHPNTTGYRFLADETVKYIVPKLKNRYK